MHFVFSPRSLQWYTPLFISPLIFDTLCLFTYVIKVCRWLCLSVHVCMWYGHVCAPVCGGHRSILGALNLIFFWDKSLLLRPGALVDSARLTTEPFVGIPLTFPSELLLQASATRSSFFLRAWRSSSGAHHCVTNFHWLSISPALTPGTLSETKILLTCHHCWGTLRDAEGSLEWQCTRASSANVNYNIHLKHQLRPQWTVYQSW